MSALVVPDTLQAWVAGIDMTAAHGEPAVDVPDHATTLVVRSDRKRELVVMGPRTRAAYHVSEPGPSCLRIRMQPGRARALLGRPVHDLADRVLPLRTLLGLDADELVADPVGALTRKLSERRADDDVVALATQMLTSANVAATAKRLHISERRLRTVFAEGTGLSPKHFARIGRVRMVLSLALDLRWADVATAAGYYDQSHMAAEFRQIMGVTPAAYLAGRRPAARRCG